MKDGETRSDSFVTFVGEMTIINAVSVAQKMLSDNILQINIYQSEYDNLDIHNGKGGGQILLCRLQISTRFFLLIAK